MIIPISINCTSSTCAYRSCFTSQNRQKRKKLKYLSYSPMIKAQKSRKNQEINTIWASPKNCASETLPVEYEATWRMEQHSLRHEMLHRGIHGRIKGFVLFRPYQNFFGYWNSTWRHIHTSRLLKSSQRYVEGREWHPSVKDLECLSQLSAVTRDVWWPSAALTCNPIDFTNKRLCHISKVAAVGYTENSSVCCSLNVIC